MLSRRVVKEAAESVWLRTRMLHVARFFNISLIGLNGLDEIALHRRCSPPSRSRTMSSRNGWTDEEAAAVAAPPPALPSPSGRSVGI